MLVVLLIKLEILKKRVLFFLLNDKNMQPCYTDNIRYAILSLTLGGFLNLTLLLTFMNVQLTIRSVASAIMYSAVMNN